MDKNVCNLPKDIIKIVNSYHPLFYKYYRYYKISHIINGKIMDTMGITKNKYIEYKNNSNYIEDIIIKNYTNIKYPVLINSICLIIETNIED